jgi:methylated-DNA-[protein]-cysteine S-methyltransferase
MMAKTTQIVTPFQERVYALLLQIPSGKVTTYAAMSKALNSSPRAVGGALRNNPFAPEVPCHRCIASTGVSFLSSLSVLTFGV